jgi:large subunit ribosomal protein L14e
MLSIKIEYVQMGLIKKKINKINFIFDLFSIINFQALVDGPTTGVKRQSMNLKYLHLTKFHVKIPHGAREKTVRNAWIKAEIDKKWGESTWTKKIAAKKLVREIRLEHFLIHTFTQSNFKMMFN